jgi:hypothetical protein
MSAGNMAEQNQRHFQRMRKVLVETRSNADVASVASLISTLDFLLNALGPVEADWKDRFLKQCWILEEVYAVLLDEGRIRFSDDETRLIDGAVQALNPLVDEQILPTDG